MEAHQVAAELLEVIARRRDLAEVWKSRWLTPVPRTWRGEQFWRLGSEEGLLLPRPREFRLPGRSKVCKVPAGDDGAHDFGRSTRRGVRGQCRGDGRTRRRSAGEGRGDRRGRRA